uniref:Uncharacterized protein n=1 Tax=Arundo donax TaxID=35708 RepID=A0A0A9F6R4_ARUDO
MPPFCITASDLAGSTVALSSSITTNVARAVAARSCTSSCELFTRLSSSAVPCSSQKSCIPCGLDSAIRRSDCDMIHSSQLIISPTILSLCFQLH